MDDALFQEVLCIMEALSIHPRVLFIIHMQLWNKWYKV